MTTYTEEYLVKAKAQLQAFLIATAEKESYIDPSQSYQKQDTALKAIDIIDELMELEQTE